MTSEQGEMNRKTGETQSQSSRSHSIFRVTFEMRNKNNPEKSTFSTLNMVDLAGSENVSKANTEGIRIKEGANINKSLLALSSVIRQLSLGSSFVNFKDSKLTRLLQPCLEGNSKTAVICTVNPLASNSQETISTLKFGKRAGAIRNHIKENEKMVCEKGLPWNDCKEEGLTTEDSAEVEELRNELSKAKELIEELEEKLKNEIDQNLLLGLDKETLTKETVNLKERITHLEGVNYKLKKENEELLRILKEIERDTTRTFESKTEEFQRTFFELERKLKGIDNENNQLKQENLKLKQEINKQEELRAESNKEKNELINHYKDYIANLKKNIDAMNHERREKEGLKENTQMNNNGLGNSSRGFGEDDLELQFLEAESNFKSQIMQKNRLINELNAKIVELTQKSTVAEQKINDYENEITSMRSRTPSVFEENDSFDSSFMTKKRKLNDFECVKKRINNSPSKDDLKKELKFIENKAKNYERQLQKKRMQEEEYTKKIQEIMKKNMDLEYRINFEIMK